MEQDIIDDATRGTQDLFENDRPPTSTPVKPKPSKQVDPPTGGQVEASQTVKRLLAAHVERTLPPSSPAEENNRVAPEDDLDDSIQTGQEATPHQIVEPSKVERKKIIGKTAINFITRAKSASSSHPGRNSRAVNKAKKELSEASLN